ncbi:shugoshin like protein [Zymoseptoria brevis]|uniref:Shugoshin like protein n=1 Tax=Zymoseptoria brevis TaxID=1047168 RepID=A0A0F4GMA4_9PEZI|nr:shugoshin like protein [Zymoseptoria brevis]
MARLNEPPAASAPAITTIGIAGAESVDALKRRFIRQNRELAKNNSAQSLKIRSLEFEISKLLSNNLELRERVLGLENELQGARRQASNAAIRRVKADLRSKLAELSGMVEELEDDGISDITFEREVIEKERILSPSRQQYRERQPLAELMRETQMPTIAEDKTFPRQTLDSESMRAIRLSDHSAGSGSPDIGPPPVAHFEFNSQESEPKEVSPPPIVDEDLLPTVNLETRRKKKDSTSKVDMRRSSILAQSPVKPAGDVAPLILRAGAKRKLADRDISADRTVKPPSQEDFTFSRRPAADQNGLEGEEIPGVVEKVSKAKPFVDMDVAPASPMKPARRVLGDKSVNMSPRKAESREAKPPKDDLKKQPAPRLPPTSKDRPPSRGRRMSAIPQPSFAEDAPTGVDIALLQPSAPDLPPKTPAASLLFSPTPSESSAKQPATRDTPPPSDLSSISNTTDGGARPSRRARPSVNYAEPSLVAKMRRPGKQMVDAISGIQDPRRTMGPSTEKKQSHSSVTIKSEPEDDDDLWKHTAAMPGSPLREKSTDLHHLPEPTSSTQEAMMPVDEDKIVAAARPTGSISSLVPATRKRHSILDRRVTSTQLPLEASASVTIDETARKLAEMELYEFKDSSSPGLEAEAGQDAAKVKKMAAGRRHSSVVKEGGLGTVRPAAAAAGAASLLGKNEGRVERAAGRRRSMMI